jgi:hypothetical protein
VATMFGIALVFSPDIVRRSSGPSTFVETRRPWLKTDDNFVKHPLSSLAS